MRKNTLLKFNIFILVFMLLFGIGFVVFGEQKTDTKVFADTNQQLQIENDGMTISNELWVALYNAYKTVTGELPAGDVLTLNMFANLPEGTPKILNLSTNAQGQSYGIRSISGLGEFDLSAFTTINLAGNNINSIGEELKNVTNLKKLDLSNNFLGTFKTDMLDDTCLATLEFLDLSDNGLSTCDLSGLQIAQVDLSNNELYVSGITYSQTDIVVDLNNNYITTIDTTKTNISYGYQGAKNEQSFEKTTDILFVPSANIDFTKIEIYENDELYDTLLEYEKITLPVGNYTLKFLDNNNTQKQDSISFKVMLPKVTAKMFVNGEEVEFSSILTQDTVVKFYGEDGAEIFVSVSNSNYEQLTEVEITKNGTVIVTAYQTKDGYSSNTASFYFSVRKSTLTSWIIIFVGIVGFVLLYYVFKFVVNKIMQKTSPNSTNKNQKGKLD